VSNVRHGSKDLIRQINEALVLSTIRRDGPVTRARIAERTGLSAAAVTVVTSSLSQAGMVRETTQGPSTGGRPPRLLVVNPAGGYAVGARITESDIDAVLVDLTGAPVHHARVSWRRRTASAAAEAISDAFSTLAAQAPDGRVLGVGVSLSGVVDHVAGVVRHSGSLGWQDAPLRTILADRLGLPVTIDKHVNTLATALMMDATDLEAGSLIVINIGPSIGMALVFNGALHRGEHGSAGAFGHTSCSLTSESRRVCHCGARDCLETVASEWGMLRELHRAGVSVSDIDDAARRAAEEDRVQSVFTTAGRALGRAAANVAKVFDPRRVIVVGEGVRLGAPLLEPFEAEFHRVSRSEAGHDFEVQSSLPDELSWSRGAAWQLLSEVFEVPLAGRNHTTSLTA
jgi:predicted NBD/HSP70 family sugar kinase